MAPHSSTLAWKIPWMEEPGGLQSMGLWTVGHDWATSLSLFTFMHWRRKWQSTRVFLPGESQGQGAWWAAVYGVTQNRTRLKQLSSSFCIRFHQVELGGMSISTDEASWAKSLREPRTVMCGIKDSLGVGDSSQNDELGIEEIFEFG